MGREPLLRKALKLIEAWDLSVDPENTSAGLAIMVLEPIVRAKIYERPAPDPLELLKKRAQELLDAHGRLDVPWEKINRLRRGTVDLGIGGGPDVLHAVYGKGPGEDGCFTGRAGDSYVLMVEWDEDGKVHSESIHQYGSATMDETSPHYADQSPLFVARKLKPVWLDEEEIRANLEREYRPGRE